MIYMWKYYTEREREREIDRERERERERVQFKMVSVRSEKPIIMCSTPLPLERFQCSSD